MTTHRSGLLGRVATFCFNLRTLGRRQRAPDVLPMQQPKLNPWPPLHIEKRSGQCCEHCVKHRKRRRRNQLLYLLVIILLLYLLGNTVALDILTSPGEGSSSSSDSTALSANQQLCLSEFEINAPVNASLYPCSTCLSTLQSVSSKFLNANTQDASQIQNAIQFCGLRGVFVEANGQGQSSLSNGGWMQNNDVCGWSGVECDGEGRVTSLYVVSLMHENAAHFHRRELSTPGVPTIIPNELGAITTLQSLQVVGDNQYPGAYWYLSRWRILLDALTSWLCTLVLRQFVVSDDTGVPSDWGYQSFRRSIRLAQERVDAQAHTEREHVVGASIDCRQPSYTESVRLLDNLLAPRLPLEIV